MTFTDEMQAGACAEVVVALVVRSDGRVLMIRRKQAEGPLRWSFPGGKVNFCEPERLASQREVKEEAGVDCVAIRKIGQWHHPDTSKEIAYWFCHHGSGEAKVAEPQIIDRVGWFTPAEIKKKVKSHIFPALARELATIKPMQESGSADAGHPKFARDMR